MMDINLLSDYAYFASTLLAIGAMVYAWLTGRSKANSACLVALSERVTKSEVQIKHLSDQYSEIKSVHSRIDEVAKNTANIDGQMSQINRNLNIIQRALIGDNNNG